VPDERAATPSPQELQAYSQSLTSQLASLHEAMVQQLAARLEELAHGKAREETLAAQGKQLLETHQSELKSLSDKYHAEVRALEGRLAKLTADNEGLQASQLQWAVEREDHLKARKLAETHQADLQQQLSSVADENQNLKELHSRVTDQAKNLASEWGSRRQALAADSQRLRTELEQATKTLESSREREKQWQAQVYKLQDELRGLREATSRMTLTDEQSHRLLSQLNAIIGFAEVLLDEGANRATGAEREQFLHDIRDSGAHLAGYVQQLTTSASQESAAPAPDGVAAAPEPAPDGTGRTILVVASDAGIRERAESFLGKAGYQVVFTSESEETVKRALELQPLAVMIDTELPDRSAQGVVDTLLREARVRDIPVVLIASTKEEPLSLTMDRYDFLSKPINRQQMLQLMVKYDLLADRRRTTKMPTSVLVIDDDARNTRLVKAMLKPYTVNVVEADGGAAGIKLAQRFKPDLIILDLMMPDVDGFQVVSALRNDPNTNQIPILIYTAKNITADDRQRLRDNIQTIIRKGELSKEQFLDLVYKRGERRTRPADVEAA
jgi:CheY-like chemotaxis protein